MARDLSAKETRERWTEYYSTISGSIGDETFESEFNKYVGTHTWNNSIRIIAKYCEFVPNCVVLDAGAGWGRLLLGLTDLYRNLRIAALDQSEVALGIGKKVLGTSRNSNSIEWKQGDIQALPYPDDTFDIVYSARVFQHLNDPTCAANELVRVLKPNGTALIMVQNKLCPLNATYYSRLYSPSQVKEWFRHAPVATVDVTTMDFYPSALPVPRSLSRRMWIEEKLGTIPIIRWFGGKTVLTAQK